MSGVLGIDPGSVSGAWAVLRDDGTLEVADLPTVTNGLDGAALARLVRSLAPRHAVVEQVGPMPKQGVSSTFKFGAAYGVIQGVLGRLRGADTSGDACQMEASLRTGQRQGKVALAGNPHVAGLCPVQPQEGQRTGRGGADCEVGRGPVNDDFNPGGDMNDEPEMATWWTPAGWAQLPRPAAHIALGNDPEWLHTMDCDDLLKRHGYVFALGVNEDFAPVKFDGWQHAETKIFTIEVTPYGVDFPATFFVSESDWPAFLTTKYLEMVQANAKIAQAEDIRQIAKTMTAWVRHGNDVSSISEDGLRSPEERKREREEWERSQSETQRRAVKKAVADHVNG